MEGRPTRGSQESSDLGRSSSRGSAGELVGTGIGLDNALLFGDIFQL